MLQANKALKIAEEKINKFNTIDTLLNTIYNTFSLNDSKEMEQKLNLYLSQLDLRNDEYEYVEDVITYLEAVIKTLQGLNLSKSDRKSHKKRIAEMKRQIEYAVEFIDEEVIVKEEKIAPDLSVFEEVQNEKKNKK